MLSRLNFEEKEVVKLANYFHRNAKIAALNAGVSGTNEDLLESCNKIVDALTHHANHRAMVLERREGLNKLIKDNASCPGCQKVEFLKLIGTDINEDLKFNKYKCRKCNISFVWNRPNNPWDFIAFIDKLIGQLTEKINVSGNAEQQTQYTHMLEELKSNKSTLKATIDQADEEYQNMLKTDEEMTRIVKQFKKVLLIEKIKLMD